MGQPRLLSLSEQDVRNLLVYLEVAHTASGSEQRRQSIESLTRTVSAQTGLQLEPHDPKDATEAARSLYDKLYGERRAAHASGSAPCTRHVLGLSGRCMVCGAAAG